MKSRSIIYEHNTRGPPQVLEFRVNFRLARALDDTDLQVIHLILIVLLFSFRNESVCMYVINMFLLVIKASSICCWKFEKNIMMINIISWTIIFIIRLRFPVTKSIVDFFYLISHYCQFLQNQLARKIEQLEKNRMWLSALEWKTTHV